MTNNNAPAEGVSLVYQCKLNLSTRTLDYLAGLLRSRLKAIRSPWRSLPPGKIAVLVLAMLRHDQRLLDLAGGNGVPEATLRRWRDEMIGLLAAKAPRLDRALRQIARRGGEAVLIDGTLIPTQRRTGADDRPNYSGKHHRHGLHFLALTDEKGNLIWISAARPGRTHDTTAARRDKIVEHLKAAGLGALADLGFLGVDKPDDPDDMVIVTGCKATRSRKLTPGQKQANRVLAAGRAPVEHGFAHLKALAHPGQAPHRSRPRHRAPTRAPRPDQLRSQPLTDSRRTIKTADSCPRPARAPQSGVTPAPLTSTFEDGEASLIEHFAIGGRSEAARREIACTPKPGIAQTVLSRVANGSRISRDLQSCRVRDSMRTTSCRNARIHNQCALVVSAGGAQQGPEGSGLWSR